ncbi:MAG: class I SAM-dependent methyltransferase [Parachlamydiaceae bacterium]
MGIAKKLGEKGNVVALDLSPEQIEVAKKNAIEQNVSNIEWKVGNIYDLTQYQAQFDIVHCRFVLSPFKGPDRRHQAACARLKTGRTPCDGGAYRQYIRLASRRNACLKSLSLDGGSSALFTKKRYYGRIEARKHP